MIKHEEVQECTHFHQSSISGFKAGDDSVKDTGANEEGTSDTFVALAGGSGVCFFLCVVNGIFLIGERVGHKLNILGNS